MSLKNVFTTALEIAKINTFPKRLNLITKGTVHSPMQAEYNGYNF